MNKLSHIEYGNNFRIEDYQLNYAADKKASPSVPSLLAKKTKQVPLKN